jgi:GNAT superfamily N-acetyltransferase
MSQFVAPRTPAELEEFCSLPGLSPLTPEVSARQRPDAQWLLRATDGTPAGRCSLWWSGAPSHAGQCLGYIGHYAARDAKAAAELLHYACEQLAPHAGLAVAPMDGNTWNRYRLLTERGTEPVFFLEPDNPDDWPSHFTENGFTPLANYFSALNEDLNQPDQRTCELMRRHTEQGIRLRPVNLERFEDELRALCPLALSSFQQNFLYTPISPEDFLAQYLPIRPYLRPELVLIAEMEKQPIGFMLALPDLLQAKRGQTVDTVILKTLAVHPAHMGAGLGTLLLAHCQDEAARLGYRRAIHALMHETNNSRRISSHTARPIRRYTLFARSLGGRP